MTFIKKIFEGNTDESVHEQFVRFGKGGFERRALTEIRVGKASFHLYASYDLLSDIYGMVAGLGVPMGITGVLITKRRKHEVAEGGVDGAALLGKINGADFALLDIDGGAFSVKCKKRLPKPGKELDARFISADLPLGLLKEFVFDADGFKQASISHTITISDIIVPAEHAHDAGAARLHACRKGTVMRNLVVDGQAKESSKEFCV